MPTRSSSVSSRSSSQTPAAHRRRSARIYWPLALFLVFLAGLCTFFRQAIADDPTPPPPDHGTVHVIGGAPPTKMYTGQKWSGGFDASITGDPVTNQECTLKDVVYSWSSSHGTMSPTTSSTTSHSTLELNFSQAGTYHVTVSASVDYKTSCSETVQHLGPGTSPTYDIEVVDQKVWDVGSDITATPGAAQTIKEGTHTMVEVTHVKDVDHWKKGTDQGTDEGTDEDTVNNYSWSGPGHFDSPDQASSGWTAPQLGPDDGESQTFELTCTIDDRPKDIDTSHDEGGTRDDGPKAFKVEVTVTQKFWYSDDDLDPGHITPAVSFGSPLVVEQGQVFTASVVGASDTDYYTDGDNPGQDNPGTEADDLTYTWSGAPGLALSGTDGQSVQVTASLPPGNVESQDIILHCTVDDTPKQIGENDGGSRDDRTPLPIYTIVRVVRKRTWSSAPAIAADPITASQTTVRPGGLVVLGAPNLETDTWTDPGGNSGVAFDQLRHTWDGGAGQILGSGSSVVWEAPPASQISPNGTDITVSCVLDDSLNEGQTGVVAPDAGTRNDAPVGPLTVTIHVDPDPCGQWKHDYWDEAATILWDEDAQGYPQPQTPQATEHAKWEDKCDASDTKNPKSEVRQYKLVKDIVTMGSDGVSYRDVSYQASSAYGGPNTTLLTGRRPINRNWTPNTGIEGGDLTAPANNVVMKAGESLSMAVTNATDSDKWTRGQHSEIERDDVSYSWSSGSVGSFNGATNGSSASWTAPAEEDVPAGAEGLSVTFTCTIDDIWSGDETGVKSPDTGTRNDTQGISHSVTVKVLRSPCGRWVHEDWQGQTIGWKTDSNGDPEPIAPDKAIETVRWDDSCSGQTKPDETRNVPYTLLSDKPVQVDGVWYREVQYRAFSTCPEGDSTPSAANEPLTDRRPLPRHWTTPGDLNGGSMQTTISGVPFQKDTPATTPGQAVAVTIPVGADVSFAVKDAKDNDTYTYWGVPGTLSDDTIKYKWKLSGPASISPAPITDLGTASGAAVSALVPGTYTLTGTVDDASSGDETGVTAPDLGNRNDDSVAYSATIKVVAKEWDTGTPIGDNPKFNADGSVKVSADHVIETTETGRMIAPQDQRATQIDAAGHTVPAPNQWKPQTLYVRPGQTLDCQVEEAYDYDHWKQELPEPDAGHEGATNKPPYQEWVKDTVKYKWTVTGPAASSFTGDTSSTAKWTAPSAAPGTQITGTYTLKCTIDDKWDGQETGVAPPGETGSRNDAGSLVRTVQVVLRETPSYAELKVFPSKDDGTAIEAEKNGPVGGKMWAYLYVTVGINQQLDPSISGASIRVDEPDPIHAGQTSPLPYVDLPASFADWEHYQGKNPNTGVEIWGTQDGFTPTVSQDEAATYRTKVFWDSTKQPLGHNGNHVVSLVKVTDNDPATNDDEATELRFVKANGDVYNSGPASRNVDVENLVIDEVSTSNGTSDYFKFDGSADAPSALKQPVVNMTVKDDGDPHVYLVRLRVRGTDVGQESSILYQQVVASPGAVPFTLGANVLGASDDPLHPQKGLGDKGTYNFQIQVLEYKTIDQATQARDGGVDGLGALEPLDKAFNRSDIFIPDHEPETGTRQPGHDGRLEMKPSVQENWWYLSHYLEEDGSNTHQSLTVNVDFLNPHLDVDASRQMALNRNTYYHNKVWYKYSFDKFEFNKEYIAVTTALDDHAALYRDHKNRSILAKNARATLAVPTLSFDPADKSDERICAGGHYTDTDEPDKAKQEKHNNDEAHVAKVTGTLTLPDPADATKTIPAPSRICRISIVKPVANNGAQFVTIAPDGSTTFSSDAVIVTSDVQGKFTVKVISGAQAGTGSVKLEVETDVRAPKTGLDLDKETKDIADVKTKALDDAKNASDAEAAKRPPSDVVTQASAFKAAYIKTFLPAINLILEPLAAQTDEEAKKAATIAETAAAGDALAKARAYVSAYADAYIASIHQWQPLTPPTPDYTIIIGRTESRRLFGIKDWTEIATPDNGWEFVTNVGGHDAPKFTLNVPYEVPRTSPPNPQLVTCRVYVRFHKDTKSPPDLEYFSYKDAAGELRDLTMDRLVMSAGRIDDGRYDRTTVIGGPNAPHWNSIDVPAAAGVTPNPGHQIWWPVNGHKLEVLIRPIASRVTGVTPATVAKAVTFCQPDGKPVPGAQITTTGALKVTTKMVQVNGVPVEGVAEFTIRVSDVTQFVNEITFGVEDVTIR